MASEPNPPRKRPVWPMLVLVAAAVVAWSNSFNVPFLLDDGPAITANPTIRELGKWGQILWPEIDGGATTAGRPLVNASVALNWALSGERVWSYHAVNLAVHVGAGILLWGVSRRLLEAAGNCGMRNAECGLGRGNPEAAGPGAPAGAKDGTLALRAAPSYRGVGRSARERERERVRIAGNPGAPAPGYRTAGAEVSGSTEKSPGPPGPSYREKGAEVGAARGRVNGFADAMPFFAALIWMLHPLQTAAVTYVVQRAEAMAAMFVLLTVYAFQRFAGVRRVNGSADATRERERLRERERIWAVVSVGACLCGMATKETAVVAPLIVLLYDRTFVAGSFAAAWRTRRGYYLAMAATWLLSAVLVFGNAGRGGTAGFGTVVTPWEYFLTQCGAIVQYVRLAIWPSPLVFDYGTATVSGVGAVWWQLLMLVVAAGATSWALVKRPRWGFAGAVFFLLLAPSSSFVPVASQTMAEHRMYLALAVPVALLVVGLQRWLGRAAAVVLAVVAVAAGAATFARNRDYATAEVLWADTIAKRPGNPRAHHNLGLAKLAAGDAAGAERHLRDALALAPKSPESHYNLALVLVRQGRSDDAMAHYRESLALEPEQAAAHNNLANLLLAAGRTDEAGRHYAEAVRVQPDFAGARNSYGNWLLLEGRAAEALAQFEAALRVDADTAELRFNAGNACAALGRFEEAAGHFRAAARLDPQHAEARNNLGNVLLELDRLPEALAEFEAALRLQPDYFEPRRTLALLYLMHLNRPAEARAHLEVLARMRPGDAEVRAALERARGAR